MTKPTSKVIQISSWGYDNLDIRALCKDGSIWEKSISSEDWSCVLEANNV